MIGRQPEAKGVEGPLSPRVAQEIFVRPHAVKLGKKGKPYPFCPKPIPLLCSNVWGSKSRLLSPLKAARCLAYYLATEGEQRRSILHKGPPN